MGIYYKILSIWTFSNIRNYPLHPLFYHILPSLSPPKPASPLFPLSASLPCTSGPFLVSWILQGLQVTLIILNVKFLRTSNTVVFKKLPLKSGTSLCLGDAV